MPQQTLADIRAQYPQYNDMSDTQLADALYQRHYSDMPREDFNRRIGLSQSSGRGGSVDDWRNYLDRETRLQAPENANRPDYPQTQERLAQELAAAGQRPPQMGRGEAFMRGAVDAGSFSLADEAAGAVAGARANIANVPTVLRNIGQMVSGQPGRRPMPSPLPRDAQQEASSARENVRNDLARSYDDRPVTSFGGAVAGGLTTAATGGQALRAVAPTTAAAAETFARARPIVSGVLAGAAEGGAYGLGSGQGGAEERAQSAGMGATFGAATGGLVPAAARGAQQVGRVGRATAEEVMDAARAGRISVPELDDLARATRRAYQQVDDAGAVYTRRSTARLADDVTARAREMNLNPRLTPRAQAVVDEIQGLAEREISLTELEQLRRAVRRDLMSATEPGERAFGGMIIGQIDEMIDRATPRLSGGGQPGAARRLISEARQASRTQRAAEALQDALDAAQLRASSSGTGGNVENAIRQELRRLITNKRTRSLYTDEQRSMILRAVKGDGLQNLLRTVGGFSPDKGFFPALISGGSLATMGPVGAVVPAAGYTARHLGEARQNALIDRITRTVRTGQ